MRYCVDICDFGSSTPRPVRVAMNVSLTAARRICEQAARRGARLYDGPLQRHNWGACGGAFPAAYRSATITLA